MNQAQEIFEIQDYLSIKYLNDTNGVRVIYVEGHINAQVFANLILEDEIAVRELTQIGYRADGQLIAEETEYHYLRLLPKDLINDESYHFVYYLSGWEMTDPGALPVTCIRFEPSS